MKATTLKSILAQTLREKSGLEQHRPYLGMSGIGYCPRKLYFEFINGSSEFTDQQHWYCWTGYLNEAAVIRLIADLGAQQQQFEIVAGFDARFRGHIDYLLNPMEFIEIKSVGWDKFCKIREANRPEYAHLAQVQMYLRHGGYQCAKIIYIARDVPHREFDGMPLWVLEIYPDDTLANRLDAKAQRILAAIDANDPPECECSWCRS